MAQILIVDDEVRHCRILAEFLTRAGHNPLIAGSAERAFEIAAEETIELILLDIRLPGLDGLSALNQLRELAHDAPVVIMTAFGTLDTAAEAVRAGVFEYLVKPFSLQELKTVLGRVMESRSILSGGDPTPAVDSSGEVVIGRSPVMQRIFNRVALAAASDVPVLLTGESGSGKEIFARAVHRYSPRHSAGFHPIFLAALSPGVVESELFGHARGSYTGADQHRAGLLEQAAGGTVLLDELGDIPLSLQVKLLRAIDRKEVTRVGEDTRRPIDVRFIAATNKSLPDLIAAGQFREDLYYRLSVYHIELPPLRDRAEDIPDLAHHFLARSPAAVKCPGFLPSAMAELQARPWFGNIRELRNAVEHAAIAARGGAISPEHLPRPVAGKTGESPGLNWESALDSWITERLAALDPLTDRATLHQDLLNEIEPALIELTLSRCRRNQTAAARILGLDPKTLRSKLSQVRSDES